MLILTRRVGETLMIGDEVSVTVLGVKGNQVRLGVNAPKDIAVHREEIYQRILHERTGFEGDSAYDGGAYERDYTQQPQERYGNSERGYQERYERPHHDRGYHASERGYQGNYSRFDDQAGYERRERAPHGNGDLNHLENQRFGNQGNFNPNFNPFDDDFYNR